MAREKQKIDTNGKFRCTTCGDWILEKDFYKSNSSIYKAIGFLPICKDCVSKKFEELFSMYNNIKITMYKLCGVYNIPFYEKTYEGALETSKKRNMKVFQAYFSKLNSFGEANSYGEFFFEGENIEEKNNITSINYNLIGTDFKVTDDLIRFWGSNFQAEEYEYLSEKLDEYLNTYECETPVMQELLKQAAFESLEIRNKRQKKEDVSKNLKNLQDILGSANIKPNQESGANANEQATFGTLLKKWENEDPVPEPDEEWKDVDGIGKYIRVWFLGHLCKMMGVNNDYSKEYEEEMSRLRVDLPSDELNSEEMDEGEL